MLGLQTNATSDYMDTAQLQITESLFAALCRFRDPNKEVYLWADQLCINQNDLKERSAQVSMMADIYEKAHRLVIWLGEPGEQHETAFAMMRFLHGSLLVMGRKRESTLPEVRQEWQRYMPNVTLDEGLAAFSTIANRPWFQRLWVFQEVTSGWRRILVCGQHSVPYEDALQAFNQFSQLVACCKLYDFDASEEKRIFELYKTAGVMQKSIEVNNSRLLELVMATSHLKASDPHDRVFALKSLVDTKTAGSWAPRVDYKMEIHELWREAVRCILSGDIESARYTKQAPGVLALRATHGETTREGSSWAPDFGALTIESHRKHTWYVREARRCFAGGHFYIGPVPEEGRILTLTWTGALLGQVQHILPTSSTPSLPSESSPCTDPVEFAHRLVDWHSSCYEFVREIGSNINGKSFANLLRRDVTQYRTDNPHQDVWSALRTIVEHGEEHTSNPADSFSILDDLRTFILPADEIGHMDFTRLLASTTDGYLGWIPRQAKVGDFVCLLRGCAAPFIVRKTDEHYYSIVGDAYISGIMRGEAWSEDLDIQEEIVII